VLALTDVVTATPVRADTMMPGSLASTQSCSSGNFFVDSAAQIITRDGIGGTGTVGILSNSGTIKKVCVQALS